MAILNATTLSGLVLLLYISSFAFFALLRIATGISIQRLGYFSLRRIVYSPGEGLRLEIRRLGLSLHRPTFIQPTWISLKLEGLKLSVDVAAFNGLPKAEDTKAGEEKANSAAAKIGFLPIPKARPRRKRRSQLWKKLTDVKEKIKRLHRKLHWLRVLDVVAIDTSVDVKDIGRLQIGLFTMAVDTRRKMMDRGRLFRHKKDPSGDQHPAEWIFTTKSILLTVAGSESAEVLDSMSVNIHGILYKEREGLRDTSIAIKLGRLVVPFDDLLTISSRFHSISAAAREAAMRSPIEAISFSDVVEELDRPGSREEDIVQTVADSKEFVSSILRGVQEIQMALSFIRVSRELGIDPETEKPLTLNVVTHEIGIDVHRLEQGTPAHRMYFNPSDVAHQALIAAISVSVSIDNAGRSPGKILYIPMATTTVKTTLPSKTVTFAEERDANERNTNILFANLVITSPSVDLSPDTLAQLLSLPSSTSHIAQPVRQDHHRLISRLLPKASIKLSVQEPVLRFLLPVNDAAGEATDEYDLLISAISSISLDVESSHSMAGEIHYSINAMSRIVSHQLYYQTSAGSRYDLVLADTTELKLNLIAADQVRMTISGSLRTLSVRMVREMVSSGVYRIFKHFKRAGRSQSADSRPAHTNFLRKLPKWLVELHLEGSDFSLELAGIDSTVSKQTRGLAMLLESWTADYCTEIPAQERRPSTARRRPSTISRPDDSVLGPQHLAASNSKTSSTDGRRLTMTVKGLEAYVIESSDQWETDPCLRVPSFELACSTSRDLQGPILHFDCAIRAAHAHFSLYRYYATSVAIMTLQNAFQGPAGSEKSTAKHFLAKAQQMPGESSGGSSPSNNGELVTADVKVASIQVKADLPAKPALLLQIYDLVAGRHRWSAPFLRAHLLRLHAEAPHLQRVFARLVSASSIRVDVRQSRKKVGNDFVAERSVDVATDFIRLGVPRGLTMFRVFDNLVNVTKTIEQLHHRLKTRKNDYILEKAPQGPKRVPRLALRSKALMFEMEEDPMEWKLGTIFRSGLNEQKQRLARAEAFRIKAKKLEEERASRGPSHQRRHSQQRDFKPGFGPGRNRSQSRDSQRDSSSTQRGRRSNAPGMVRYNSEGVCGLSGSAKVQAEEAETKLHEHNARSWKRRIDAALNSQSGALRDIKRMFAAADEPPHDMDEDEMILAIPNRPGLMTSVISDLHLVIDKPSFPLSGCPQFLNELGKGMPLDMKYSLLVPMNIALDMGEARVMLRDYPLSLLHVPTIRPGQPPKLASWSLRTDFVIAEEYRDIKSSRTVTVGIVPPGQIDEDGHEIAPYSLDVRRTVSPVKTYSNVTVDINTSLPTTISWGNSLQPVIQDMMMVIETFTKPEVDPSDRVGFWDKIRLNFHSRLLVNWKGDGDVHLRLKGSRDPYKLTGYGAGFVMCWRDNVQWAIHANDDPKQFMTVKSGEYVLAVPDYSHEARHFAEQMRDDESIMTSNSQKNAAMFKKVVMKLSGNVRWQVGLVFERDVETAERCFDFIPHYEVMLKNPRYISDEDRKNYDAFRRFRSNHIHLSIAVAAPFDREWSFTNLKASQSYNSVHLSPRYFTHFFNWWSLFSGIMSLPIRQGRLWPGPEKTSKKFGRHLATIKYNLLLSPVYIAHVYKHKDAEDYAEDVVSATGLKLRLDSFILDLHQRREWFDTIVKGRSKQTRTSAMRINEGQLDFINADLRAVSANIGGTNADDLMKANDDALSISQQPTNIDLSRFDIPDHDMSWIDMDDFVELNWVLPSETNPETRILPLAFTPRFTYFRQTEYAGSIHGDASRTSQFGKEPTHYCVMSQDNDPRRVQRELVRERIKSIKQQIETHARLLGEQELRVIRDGHEDASHKTRHGILIKQARELDAKYEFLLAGLAQLSRRDSVYPTNGDGHSTTAESSTFSDIVAEEVDALDYVFPTAHEDDASTFNNRFMIHNMQFKWNNSLRNVILRYGHQVSQRRGFIYYLSRRAVKFILDIVDEQNKTKCGTRHATEQSSQETSEHRDQAESGESVQSRIDQLLNDAQKYVDAGDAPKEGSRQSRPSSESEEQAADKFVEQNSYHLRLIAPQIQLQSEKNVKAVTIVAAKGMELKVISIMDLERLSDDVSGLVQRRFSVDMDGAQFFVTTQKLLYEFLHLYPGQRYGNAPGSSWPPWVTLEVMFDFDLNPFGFERVIQKTSANVTYEKYNTLRLKYNEELSRDDGTNGHDPKRNESRMDYLSVDFPRVRATCDSSQYYALYIIVMDLLLYSEPREKVRSERLEKIMLASDFSDLRGAPEMVTSLQERIRQLEDIKDHFQVNAKSLDRQGWQDRLSLEKDLVGCEDELFFIMKAITTSQSQRKNDDRQSTQSQGLLRWYLTASEVVWNLMRDHGEPLLEFQLRNAAYERIDNSDGSNHNAMEIERVHGLNLLPTALYPEMLGSYQDPNFRSSHLEGDHQMLRVQWYMLEAIAGIPVLERFEIAMFPIKLQLERDLGKKIFEYIFPASSRANALENHNFSPFMVKNMQPLGSEDDPEANEAARALVPDVDPSQLYSSVSPNTSDNTSIGSRMRPTLSLAHDKPAVHLTHKNKHAEHHHHPLHFFKHSPSPSVSRINTQEANLRKGSLTNLSAPSKASSERPSAALLSVAEDDSRRRFGLSRSGSKDRREKDKKETSTDELSTMLARASNYMTLAHVKLDSVVICLSYKGKGDRNLEDLHNFVFRMPILEYRNKTWSNLDLALQLKRDFIKALISHTGAIIGNKFHHRSSKSSRLNDSMSSTAPSSQLLSVGDNMSFRDSPGSETASMISSYAPASRRGRDPSPSPLRRSFSSVSLDDQTRRRPSPLTRTDSIPSSMRSSRASSVVNTTSPPSESSASQQAEAHQNNHHGPRLSLNALTRSFSSRDSGHRTIRGRSLGRETSGNGNGNNNGEDSDQESTKKKAVLLLGRKILGSLT